LEGPQLRLSHFGVLSAAINVSIPTPLPMGSCFLLLKSHFLAVLSQNPLKLGILVSQRDVPPYLGAKYPYTLIHKRHTLFIIAVFEVYFAVSTPY
jgi:hypothetical protein